MATMKRTTVTRKLMHAIEAIGRQKMELKFTKFDQETWNALHAAEQILDKAFWSALRGE